MKYRPIDTKTPVDMQFSPVLVRVAPKVFVLKGTLKAIGATKFVLETGERTFGPVDGCRVEIRLEDEGYQMPVIQTYTLNSAVDPNVTIMQDAASVRDGKIGGDLGKKIDMSQDRECIRSRRRVTRSRSGLPRITRTMRPIQVQDRIGWLGEGLGPQPYLVVTTATTPHARRHHPHSRPADAGKDVHAHPRRHSRPGGERFQLNRVQFNRV